VRLEGGFKELEIVAYVDRFKVVGAASFGVGQRATSRRASDFIRSFNDTRLTLAGARIYEAQSGALVETSPFVVLNLDKVDFLYAREEERLDADGREAVAHSDGVTAAPHAEGASPTRAEDDTRPPRTESGARPV